MDVTVDELEAAASSGAEWAVLFIHADPEIDPLALIEDQAVAFVWQQPASDLALAGLGSAWQANPADITDAGEVVDDLRSRVAVFGGDHSPTLASGFAFDSSSTWQALPPALVRLPRITYVRDYEGARWQLACRLEDPYGAREELASLHRQAMAQAQNDSPKPLNPGERPRPLDDPIYRKLVESAIAAIDAGEFEKVVLARSVETDATPPVPQLLARLRLQHPEAATFAFSDGGAVFCGATPELLVRWNHGRAESVALAGTIRRGESPAEDDRLAATLAGNPKEVAEHEFVIDHVVSRLNEAGLAAQSSPTEIMKLEAVQHLRTKIEATGSEAPGQLDRESDGSEGGLGAIGLADLLHPTPAVGGTPDSSALDFIARHEGLDRGWYAGPIGFVNLAGEGEFWVALRCALIDRDHSTLYAGAGIVADSDPDAELAETSLKLQNLGAAIGLR